MDLIQPDSKRTLKERNVKTFPVVGNQDPVFLDVFLEFLKIFSLDLSEN